MKTAPARKTLLTAHASIRRMLPSQRAAALHLHDNRCQDELERTLG
jgi:hypothetical protein